MAVTKIQATKNYRLFARNADNRPLDIKKHKRLELSMKQYGFLRCFPIVCCRDKNGNLIVKDGQHRLALAESLGLTVYWVEEDVDFDVAVINCTSKVWAIRDYAQKHALNGKAAYEEGMTFAENHKIPMGTAFALLAGTTSLNNVMDAFVQGTFRVKDRAWADAVASIYGPIVAMSPHKHNARLLEACMAVCRVQSFDAKRLISGAEKCREKLLSYSTREAYLDMLESVYNFNRQKLVGLKAEAMMVMRERNATVASVKRKKEQAA